jgi:hypothetical protein
MFSQDQHCWTKKKQTHGWDLCLVPPGFFDFSTGRQ